MLQYVAVWCSMVQCVAVCCNGRIVNTSIYYFQQHVGLALLCCSVLQYVAVRCSALQCVAVRYSALQCGAVWCSMLQCVAVCCSVVQCVAAQVACTQRVLQ